MNCRLCGNERLKSYYSQGNNSEYKFYKCDECGLVNYDLSTGLDQRKYDDTYIDPFDESAKMNITQTKTCNFIKDHIDLKGRAFDIGCGNGKLLHLLREDGWIVKGLELSPFLAESINNNLKIEVEASNFLEYNSSNGEISDLVILRHVLEHLPDPILSMEKINSFLKTGGHAVLEFPNIEAFDLKFKRLLQRLNIHQKKYRHNYKPGHCNEYSRRSFEYLTSETGFEIVYWETYSYKPLTDFIYNRIKIGNKARTIIKKVKDI